MRAVQKGTLIVNLTIKISVAVAAGASLIFGTAGAQEPYLGEINIFASGFCPKGWARAEGQLLAINQNQALFALLGATYGGDGRVTFALPDFRGRVSVGVGQGPALSDYARGAAGGAEVVTLAPNEMPLHAHLVSDLGTPPSVLVKSGNGPAASLQSTATPPDIQTANAGGGQAHLNLQPYLALSTCIALQGVFPLPN